MRRVFLACVFLPMATAVFAINLRSYPEVIQNGTMMFDVGVGFGTPVYGSMLCPPISLNFEYALPVFSLPFTFGLKFAYSADNLGFTNNNFGIAFRTAYHLNFGVPHLDTYVALNLGDIISTPWGDYGGNSFWIGIMAGARYYFKYQSHFGVYLEAGFDKLTYVNFGGTVRF
ncbi:hypothetical protein FACS1894110_09360 [Spirochaetia bacterium]|nr:hypothetical protein FACS1894110_09360 [Spirochaetia bacterium]